MAIRKPNQALLVQYRDKLVLLGERRSKLIELQQGKDTLFWKNIKSHLEDISRMSTDRIDSILFEDKNVGDVQAEQAILRLNAGYKKVCRDIIDAVERTDVYLDRIQTEIGNVKDEIKRIEDDLELLKT